MLVGRLAIHDQLPGCPGALSRELWRNKIVYNVVLRAEQALLLGLRFGLGVSLPDSCHLMVQMWLIIAHGY